MKVFKFGGASIQTVEKIQNMAAIIQEYRQEKIMLVISAMGKTTNALEKVVAAFFDGQKQEALDLFQQIKQSHHDLAKYLLVKQALPTERLLTDLFTEVEWLLHDKPVREYDYYYDQIVCIGELLSTTIISAYLNEEGIRNKWIDVRDYFRTDSNFREANIKWNTTCSNITHQIIPEFTHYNIVVTQGFIGATDDNESTTLGREGSDYSAAIFAHILNAESLTIWKDVKGVMNADPKQFPSAEVLTELNYDEVIEMAYYGAQVIHPKTIKPLQNKNIPLYVKSFLEPELAGTVIHNALIKNLPPIIVLKKDQVLINLKTKDFSFVGEQPVAELYKWLANLHIRPNLLSTGAVSIQVCVDDQQEKLNTLAITASALFDVELEKGFTLLTIRHPQKGLVEGMTAQLEIQMLQQNNVTVQALFKEKKN